jgi:holo-[acyl-carrier protein] synthase
MYDDRGAAMEIIGSGIDATEIARIAASIERYGDRFVLRVFTDGEIAYCRRKRDAASSFAARFAAKEAAMKALGTGHSRGVFWRGIEVFRPRGGPPQLRFHGGAATRLAAMGATTSFLTLTHSRDLAIAHVLLARGTSEG